MLVVWRVVLSVVLRLFEVVLRLFFEGYFGGRCEVI